MVLHEEAAVLNLGDTLVVSSLSLFTAPRTSSKSTISLALGFVYNEADVHFSYRGDEEDWVRFFVYFEQTRGVDSMRDTPSVPRM
jgi:hypothetical protein